MDVAAFARVAAERRPRLIDLAARIVGPRDAEDVVQDAMLLAWRGLPRFDGRSALATWLHRITVNAALTRLRGRRRRTVVALSALGAHFDAPAPAPADDGPVVLPPNLAPRLATLLAVLRAQPGGKHPVPRAARTLGMSVSTAKHQAMRLRRILAPVA